MNHIALIDELYERYRSDVYRFLVKVSVGDAFVAEDLTQETFVQLYESLHRFRGECDIKTWIIAIAKNQWFTYCKKHKREQTLAIENERFRVEAGLQLSERVEARETAKHAMLVLGKMPKKQADVVILRLFGELSFAEIARMKKINESSARVAFYRGKERLRTGLKEEYGYGLPL